jgi:hypothetical protein
MASKRIKMSADTELAIAVLEHLQNNSNKRYKTYQLTRIFKVTTTAINRACEVLPIKSSIEGRDRVWYFESEEDKAKVATRPRLHEIQKPKRDNRLMAIAMERSKEAYPNGGNFKSIC